jgi:hypothetical protein
MCSLTDLWIVVVNWNGAADTCACLDSLHAAIADGARVVVVDNGSERDDLAAVTARLAACNAATLLANAENLGFAEGANVGIRHALEHGAGFVLLLNNDAVVEDAAIPQLVQSLREDQTVGLAAPLILDEHGINIWSAGARRAHREVVCKLALSGKPAAAAPAAPTAVWAVTGCALLVRRAVFESVGLLDAEYFAYVEDIEFSRRAAANGWSLLLVPGARVRHRVSAATGSGYTPVRSYLIGRGTGLFVRTRATTAQRLAFLVAAPLGLMLAALRETLRGNSASVLAKARGYLDGLRRRPVDAARLEAIGRDPALKRLGA